MNVIVAFLLLVSLIFGFGAFWINNEKSKKIKVYISGPMTGYEDLNFPAFNGMEAEIINEFPDVQVINPVEISLKVEAVNENATYEDYLREDFRALLDCDAVVLLEGWKDSGGCHKEVTVANYIGIPCFETWAEFKNFIGEKIGY